MTQGQGRNTAIKERGFGAAFKVSISLSNGANIARFPYWHVDLNAGSGWNEKAQCEGSPIVFLKLAAQYRPNYQAFFCDHDKHRIETLCAMVGGRGYCFPGDNKEMLPVVSEAIAKRERNPKFSVGSVVCDPNGYFGKAVPHEQIAEFGARHPRIDLIFNLNVRTYQLGKGHVQKAKQSDRPTAWLRKVWPSLSEFPSMFGRRHWLISDISSAGRDRFIVAIGRNYEVEGSRAMGHYKLASEKGEEILRRVEGAEKSSDPLGTLQNVPGLSGPPCVQGRSRCRDEIRQLEMPVMRSDGDGGTSQATLSLGDV